MAGLTETAQWAPEIYQIEQTDPVHGGPPDLGQGQGIVNAPHQELANRTAWLKQQLASLQADFAALDVSGDIDARINALVAGAPAALDTLGELATALGDNDSEIAALVAQIAGKLGVNDQAADAATLVGMAPAFFRNAGNMNAGYLPMDRLLLASWTDAQNGTRNDRVMTPLRTKEAIANQSFGVGQTWQNVSGSRTTDTAYQNTTGRTIFVSLDTTNSSWVDVSNDGTTWLRVNPNSAYGVSFAVPPGGYYKTGGTIYTWLELRS